MQSEDLSFGMICLLEVSYMLKVSLCLSKILLNVDAWDYI